MAEAAIFSAIKVIGELVIQKAGFLQGVEEQVNWLKDELQMMQSFLKDASEKQAENERIQKWISDIREVAQDAEDIIETFILKVDTSKSSIGSLGQWLHFPNHLFHLNTVGKEINSIKAKLEEIGRSRERYGIQNLHEITESSSRSEGGEVEWRRQLPPWQKDKHVVGLEGDVELLLQKVILDDKELGLSIATIVGMGGSGKSTLARKVYTHHAIVDRFDSRAWAVVSSDFRPRDIVKEIMLQLLEPQEDKLKLAKTIDELPLPSVQEMLHERLRSKRYFVVLDDMWENKHWETLASIFPVEDTGSRLLLTSRYRDITKNARYVHDMKCLDADESWQLLLKKAFTDNNIVKCPDDLESIGREILKKCFGLPLAIAAVGGLLLDRNPSRSKWERVSREINSHLGENGSSVSTILELSYRNLSPELKSCFLCLGFFKEDAIIPAKKLVQVWIAQGLIQQERRGGSTMEDIGKNYLDELIKRNMVQVKNMSYNGSVKNCHVHDFLRELSIAKATEQISFEILREGEEGKDSHSLHKPRHRAIYCTSKNFIRSALKNKHLRSVFFYGPHERISVNPSYWESFELLRILEFEDFKLKNFPDTICGLTGLRYLGLRNTWIRELPRSFGRLKKLEVLDIAKNLYIAVPNVIWKIDSLRHFYISSMCCNAHLKIHTLKNLQTLSYIGETYVNLEHLTQLTSLRKLGLNNDFGFITWKSKVCSALKNFVCLTQLKLRGMMYELPNATDFPPNLEYLMLANSRLYEDPMPVLEKLPKLLCLKMDFAYDGEEMVISNEGFPSLKALVLRNMIDLKNIRVEKGGGMSRLERLEIYECPCQHRLPEELRLIATVLKK